MRLHPSIARLRVPAAVVVTVLLVLAWAPGAFARVTNGVALDDGTCVRNLQIGSDRTASSSATPTFILWGDGGLSRYEVFVDGVSIGTFNSDGWANVCVTTTVPLADGPHRLTANELAPNPSLLVTPFDFTVDTVPPATPTGVVLASYSDSGALDGITRFRHVTVTGTSTPGVAIQLYNGRTLVGGALADAAGRWSATTSTLADGVYSIRATAVDTAGNKSPFSDPLTLTVDTTPPTAAITSPSAGSTVRGIVDVVAGASDAVGIAKVDFQVDGATQTTSTSSPYTYSWNSTSAGGGPHTLTAVVTDVAGNSSTASVSVNVDNGVAATVPSAPTVTAATPAANAVTVRWSAPLDNGGAALTAYRLYRSTASGAETLLTTLDAGAGGYVDRDVSAGVTYYYEVTATNAIGESARSNEASATPFAPVTVSAAPTLAYAAAGTNSVTLAWSAPADTGGSAITGYAIYRSTATGAETWLTAVGDTTGYTDRDVTPGVAYYYEVTALNSVGESARSNEQSAVPLAPPTLPDAPTLVSATAAAGRVTLAWTAPASTGGAGVTAYAVYRSTAAGAETLLRTVGNVDGYTDTDVVPGVTYFYEVTAITWVGESARSNEQSATPPEPATGTAPGTPTGLRASGGDTTITISWLPPASDGGAAITGYVLYRSTFTGGEKLYLPVGAVTSYVDDAVVVGISYYYQVTAVNAFGESVRSGEDWATPGEPWTTPTGG